MNEEQFTIHDEKELFEELSKDKRKRSDILINLNVALQKYQNIVANIKGIREIQEYKIAVVTIENELQKVQQKNQQLKEQLNKKYENVGTLTSEILYEENTKLVQENQQLKKQYCERTDCSGRIGNSKKVEELEKRLEASEKARKEAIDKLKTLGKFDGERCTRSFKLWTADFNELISVLDIDKGE